MDDRSQKKSEWGVILDTLTLLMVFVTIACLIAWGLISLLDMLDGRYTHAVVAHWLVVGGVSATLALVLWRGTAYLLRNR